ncbi:hypothetical protein QYM36_018970 [Artemia franciscana]|uniref:Uncharacterized protein n=1 Tax=Artemia franciscana TaxID=6661 RepID=A0AA88KTG0_ARTSF|nr:hypothetical protein QYM36_018970 [Artemia franciscana]
MSYNPVDIHKRPIYLQESIGLSNEVPRDLAVVFSNSTNLFGYGNSDQRLNINDQFSRPTERYRAGVFDETSLLYQAPNYDTVEKAVYTIPPMNGSRTYLLGYNDTGQTTEGINNFYQFPEQSEAENTYLDLDSGNIHRDSFQSQDMHGKIRQNQPPENFGSLSDSPPDELKLNMPQPVPEAVEMIGGKNNASTGFQAKQFGYESRISNFGRDNSCNNQRIESYGPIFHGASIDGRTIDRGNNRNFGPQNNWPIYYNFQVHNSARLSRTNAFPNSFSFQNYYYKDANGITSELTRFNYNLSSGQPYQGLQVGLYNPEYMINRNAYDSVITSDTTTRRKSVALSTTNLRSQRTKRKKQNVSMQVDCEGEMGADKHSVYPRKRKARLTRANSGPKKRTKRQTSVVKNCSVPKTNQIQEEALKPEVDILNLIKSVNEKKQNIDKLNQEKDKRKESFEKHRKMEKELADKYYKLWYGIEVDKPLKEFPTQKIQASHCRTEIRLVLKIPNILKPLGSNTFKAKKFEVNLCLNNLNKEIKSLNAEIEALKVKDECALKEIKYFDNFIQGTLGSLNKRSN